MRRLNLLLIIATTATALVTVAPTPAKAASGGVVKSVCTYSHTAADDPIVKPAQPGASHSHDFFGNVTLDAFSTLETLRTGGTTCSFLEDRSAYWVPTLLLNGLAVHPGQVAAYYTVDGADPSSVQPYPEGLRLIAGSSTATSPQSLSVTSWRCTEDGVEVGEMTSSLPSCAPGQELQLRVEFPECWDGVNTDSLDHKSHLAALPADGASCPASHPVLVPSLTLFANYPTTGGSGVTLASGGQYSAHADFFNVWDPARLQDLVSGCLAAGVVCNPISVRVDEASADESGAMVFSVSLSDLSPSAVDVDYATEDVSAVAGVDYTPVSGHLTFPANTLTQTVSVPLVDDTLSEEAERFKLRLSNAVNATLAEHNLGGTIVDNDLGPGISVVDASIAESASDPKSLICELKLSAVSDRDITVAYRTVDGSATSPDDYAATSGTVQFRAGEVSANVAITVNPDGLYTEGSETFSLELSNPVNASVVDGIGALTITDPTTVPKIYITGVTTPESAPAQFNVSLSAPASVPVSFDYSTADRTATAPADYQAVSGTLTIPAGVTAATLTVPVVNDTMSESDETFQLLGFNAVNGQLITTTARSTITDNDGLPTLQIADATVVEPTTGTRTIRFTVSLSRASEQVVNFSWSTANGTAVAPGDYVAASGSIRMPKGALSKTISVVVNADTPVEAAETFQVVLTGVTGASLADGTAIGTIKPS